MASHDYPISASSCISHFQLVPDIGDTHQIEPDARLASSSQSCLKEALDTVHIQAYVAVR